MTCPVPVSATVLHVINSTESVTITIRRPRKPVYRITLVGGGELTFTPRNMVALRPATLTEKWLLARPRDLVRVNKEDFEDIRQYWLSIATEVTE